MALEIRPGAKYAAASMLVIDYSLGVSADGLRNIYFSGYTEGSLGGPNVGGEDAFVAKIADAAVPEPNTLLLLCLGSLGLLWRRRGLVCAAILAAVVSVSFADRAHADTFGSGANTFDIEFVTIGNPGNVADTTGNPNPAGSVAYTYNMGQFEISEQMIDKANAEGGLSITKTIRGADKPATSVSWNEAARFVNWLNITSGSTPAYKFAIQPGDVGYSANANIELWTISDVGYNANNLYRNSQARYFLPSVDEWYKAAYYDPTSGVYCDYPTGSNSLPTDVATGTAAATAVYSQPTATGPANIILAGGLSPYGTTGQGGNAYEWQETDVDLVNGPTPSSSDRGIRGGCWNCSGVSLSSSFQINSFPTGELSGVGFRVASSIPEPSTLLLLCFGSLAVLWRRRGLACAAILAAVVSVSVADRAAAVAIDMVTVGNPGNAADTRFDATGFGSVGQVPDFGDRPGSSHSMTHAPTNSRRLANNMAPSPASI